MHLNVEEAVRDRYTQGARRREETLCCPTVYEDRYLAVLPREIIERDYGCGDPSSHLNAGETVLDLGSGAGKICYIAAQIVGRSGRVIGIDMNEEMLALARRYQPEIAQRLAQVEPRLAGGDDPEAIAVAARDASYPSLLAGLLLLVALLRLRRRGGAG